MECVYIFVIVMVLVVIGVCVQYSERAKAKKAYEASLQRLKGDPTAPDLREQTVALGRKYSKLTKDPKGRFEFDEVALMNDINAACARATVGQNSVAKVQVVSPIRVSGKSVTDEVERLGQLFLAGVIRAEEFERGKTLFLGAPPEKAASAVEFLQDLHKLKQEGVLSESEFNMKKWEVLSERLIPGRREVTPVPQSPPRPPPAPAASPAKAARPEALSCPKCGQPIPRDMIVPGLNRCPHCEAKFKTRNIPQ